MHDDAAPQAPDQGAGEPEGGNSAASESAGVPAAPDSAPAAGDDQPHVFALVRSGSQWRLGRRDFFAVAAATSAAGCSSPDVADPLEAPPAAIDPKGFPALAQDPASKVPDVPPAPNAVPEIAQPRTSDCKDVVAHNGAVLALVVREDGSQDGAVLASGGTDGKLKLWSLPALAFAQSLEGHTRSVTALAVEPATGRLLSADSTGGIKVWDLAARTELRSFAGEVGAVSALAASREHVAARGENEITLWALAGGERVRTIPAPKSAGLTFSRDGTLLLWAEGNAIKGQTLADGATATLLTGSSSTFSSFALTAPGHLVAATATGLLQVFAFPSQAPRSGAPVAERNVGGGERVCGVTPAGDLLLTTGNDHVIRVWSLPGLEPLLLLRGHTSKVNAVAITADGKVLATAGADKTIRVWALPSGEPKGCLLDLAAIHSTAQGIQYKVKDSTSEKWVTYTLPCGSPIPAGATCICNCVPGTLPMPAPPRNHSRTMNGSVCSCNTVCTCNTVCSCVANVRTRSGGHYWYPN